MALITGSPNQSTTNVNLTGVTTPNIQNISLVAANTEYTVTLPTNTERFRIQVRGSSKIKFSYVSGQSGTNYISLWAGAYYEETGLDISSLILYVQSSQGGETLEVLSWV